LRRETGGPPLLVVATVPMPARASTALRGHALLRRTLSYKGEASVADDTDALDGKTTAEVPTMSTQTHQGLAQIVPKRAPAYVQHGLSRSAPAALHAQRQGGEHGVI